MPEQSQDGDNSFSDLGAALEAAWDDAGLDEFGNLPEDGGDDEPLAEPEAPEPEQTSTEVSEPTEAPAIEPEPIQTPGSWSKEDRAHFENQPRRLKDLPAWTKKAQEIIARREKERDLGLEKKMREHAERIREKEGRYSAFDEAVKPYEQAFKMHGVNPAQLFSHYIAVDEKFKENPIGTALWILENRGITKEQLAQALTSQQQAQRGDPQVETLKQENARIVQYLRQQEAQRQQAAQRQVEQQTSSEVLNFAKEKDANGKLVRPFLEVGEDGQTKYPEFEKAMATAITILKQQQPTLSARETLAQAYEQACYLCPDTRAKVLEAQRLKDQEAERQKAQRAKLAGSSISGAPNGALANSRQPKDLEAALLHNWEALGLPD